MVLTFSISFSPRFGKQEVALEKQGDILIVNGDPLDFSLIPDGAELPYEAMENGAIAGGAYRSGDTVYLTAVFPYEVDGTPQAPLPITVLDDGPISFPEGRYADQL